MIGEQLGSYRIEAILGTGAMGVVYRAINDTTGRQAAVKVIGGEVGQKGKLYERFRREAEILQQFRHPNIVQFLSLGRFKGTSYFAMEYVPGETLDQMLRRRGPLPWREVVDLGIQLCDALHYAHEHGVIHRDLKPSNLMITAEGQLKLTDFGIAKDLDATALTATGRTLGTAAYMAPEQIRGTPAISHKTDLYAMGVVFYQMLTGRVPFEGGSPVVVMGAHLSQPPPRPSATVPEIPKALDDLIVKLMAKPPTDRPWDAAAVGVALTDLRDKASQGDTAPMDVPTEGDTASQASSSSATATKPPKKTKSGCRFALPALNRATLEVSLLVLVLVACLGFVAYMLWPPSAAYLHRRAARLMESSRRADWIEARQSYIDPLDRDFPNHPYREQTRAWRDRILLDEAGERARRLESPVRTRFTEPQTTGEHEYIEAYALASEASGRGDDQAAIQYWEEMARRLKPDDAEQRPWSLLAQKRAEDVRKAIAERREIVIRQLNDAERARQRGETLKALTIQAHILKHYGSNGDVADLLKRAGLNAQTQPTPPTADPSLPEVPSR